MKRVNVAISGHVKPGFEAVREAFVENFARRNELGAACCVYYRGENVVDLWGGVGNELTGEPWEEDTMVCVHSTTKGLSGLALALAHSRGLFDYDERISKYWPEFAQQGKDEITVRQLLAHQAGLFAFDETGTSTSSRISTGWRPSWPGRGRRGSRDLGRPTTPSPSGTMKASFCAESIPNAEAWGGTFRMSLPLPSDSISTFGCPKRFPIRDWLPSSQPILSGRCSHCRSHSLSRRSIRAHASAGRCGDRSWSQTRSASTRGISKSRPEGV